MENLRMKGGRMWIRDAPAHHVLGKTRGRLREVLGRGWGRACGQPGDHPSGVHRAPKPTAYPWRTRGKPGDDMRMTCGDDFAVPRRRRAVHSPCTAPVDRETRSHLGRRGLSTLSTAPITGTALLLYSRKDPSQVRAWGQPDPSAPAVPGSPHPCPTPAGGGST